MTQIVLGFTGARWGLTPQQNEKLINKLNEFKNTYSQIKVLHGDCVGADSQFHKICKQNKFSITIYPPKIKTMRGYNDGYIIKEEQEFITRNHNIVDDCDILLACPKDKNEVLRSGTWATIRYAKKKNKEIILIVDQ